MLLIALALACSPTSDTGATDTGATGDGGLDIGMDTGDTGMDTGDTGDTGHSDTPCEGDVVIDDQQDLDAFAAEACTSLDGSLVMDSADLVEVFDLPDLREITGELRVTANPDLHTVRMSLLSAVGGAVTLQGDGDGGENPLLSTVVLSSLREVGGAMDLGEQTAIESLDLQRLQTTGDGFRVELSSAATALDLGALRDIGGGDLLVIGRGLDAVDVDALESAGNVRVVIDGYRISFSSLETADALIVSGVELSMPAMVTLGSLSDENDGIRLDELDAPLLTTVEGDVDVALNMKRASLPSLETVGGDLQLVAFDDDGSEGGTVKDPVLTAIGMAALETVGGNLTVAGTFVGEGRVDLLSLQSVGGEVWLSGLHSVDLPDLQSTGGSLVLSRSGVEALGLPSLTTVGDALQLNDNENLSTVAAEALSRIEGDVVIVDNVQLPTCDAWAIAEQVEARDGVGGEVYVSGNAADSCS